MTIPNLALPLLLMLLLAFGEMLFRAKFRGEFVSWRDVVFNLNSGHIVMWYFRGLEVVAYLMLLSHFSLNIISIWPIWLQWIFGFIAWDFCFYWMHRMHHKIPLLWAVHVVHHQGEHFNLSLGIRNSWYSSLSNFPFIAILVVLGLPVEIFVVVSSIHYTVQFYNHNGLVTSSGILDKLMVTPLHHRVHHGMDEPYIDKNFGGTFLWWDRLFGTFQTAVNNVPLRFGTHAPAPSRNPFLASNLPFIQLLNRSIRFASLRPRFNISPAYIARAGFILFLVVIAYVLRETTWDPTQKTLLFTSILISTIAVGAASDNRRWGHVVWLLMTWLLPVVLLFHTTHLDSLNISLSVLLLIHSADSIYQLLYATKFKYETF